MIAEFVSLFYPHLSGRFIAATLDHLQISDDDVRAALARRLLRSKGYVADVPAALESPGAQVEANRPGRAPRPVHVDA